MALPHYPYGSSLAWTGDYPETWLVIKDADTAYARVVFNSSSYRKARTKLQEYNDQRYTLWFGDDWEEYEPE